MTEAPENNSFISIAGTMGRMEAMLNSLVAGFNEFKVSHKDDLLGVNALIKELQGRLVTLENKEIHRNGGVLSVGNIIKAAVCIAGLYLSYHMGNLSK